MSQRLVSTTKIGPDGRPIKESYQSKADGIYGGNSRPELVERRQMYQNTGTGYEKAAHERMYQGRGRKIVYENDRSSGASNSYNHFRGLRESDGPDFDREWETAAQRMGFYSDANALPYGSGIKKTYPRNNRNQGYGK